jgi:hypothetical protein
LQPVDLSWWGRRFRLPSVNWHDFFRSLVDQASSAKTPGMRSAHKHRDGNNETQSLE